MPIKYEKKRVKSDLQQLACLATNIFYEARGEPFQGQVAVALVTMNRVKDASFPKTACGVVYQSFTVVRVDETTGESVNKKLCQFSWVCEGKATPNRNSAAYKQAEQIARDVLVKKAHAGVIPDNALFFHNGTVNPNWAYQKVAQIGNHIFYSKERVRNS